MFSPFVIVTTMAVVILSLQCVTISDIAGSYAVRCYQHYPDIERSTLYDFVMLSDAANKWMKFVTFVATDHKPIGIGKTYKVAIGTQTFLFVTVEHQQGQYLILQNMNENDILNLRVEIRFATVFCESGKFEENAVIEPKTNLLPSYSFSTIKSNATVGNYSTNVSHSTFSNTASDVHHDQHTESDRGDLFATEKCGSELSFKLFSLQSGLLFQNTIGVMFRYFLGLRLEHSLTNLAHILRHMEK